MKKKFIFFRVITPDAFHCLLKGKEIYLLKAEKAITHLMRL